MMKWSREMMCRDLGTSSPRSLARFSLLEPHGVRPGVGVWFASEQHYSGERAAGGEGVPAQRPLFI
jgi:hypothetical protein